MDENSAQLSESLKAISEQLSKLQKSVDDQGNRVDELESKIDKRVDTTPTTQKPTIETHFTGNKGTVLSETPDLVPTYTPQKATSNNNNQPFSQPQVEEVWHSTETKLDTNELENDRKLTSNNIDIEAIIGGQWLVKLGVIALLIGFSFFMKYAFDNWIGPVGQVFIGYLSGAILIGIGAALRSKYKKYINYSDVLIGGGVGILYLSTFSAYHYQELIGYAVAFFLFILITVISTVTAIKYDSKNLAYFSIVGGFLTPLLLGNVSEHQKGLLFYMIILNFGVILISIFKQWKILSIIGVIFTYILLAYWLDGYYSNVTALTSVIIISIFALIYLIPTVLNQFVDKVKATNKDISVLTLNTFLFYVFSYSSFEGSRQIEQYLGEFTILCAIVFLILSVFAYLYRKEDLKLNALLAGITIFFATTAIPMTFSNQWITIVFAAEALSLIWIGFKVQNHVIRYIGLFIYAISLFSFMSEQEGLFIFTNEVGNIATFLSSAGMITLVAYVSSYYYYHRDYISELENEFVKPIAMIASQALSLYTITGLTYWGFQQALLIQAKELNPSTVRVTSYSYQQIGNLRDNLYVGKAIYLRNLFLRDLCLTVIYAMYSYILLAFASIHKIVILKKTAIGIFGITFLYLLILTSYNTSDADTLQNFLISIVLGIISIVGISAGIAFKYKDFRLVSMSLLVIVILKVFLFDTWNLSDIYRIVAYITLGLLLIGIGFVYVKYQDRIKGALLD